MADDQWLLHRTTFKKPSFAVPKGTTDCHCHVVGDPKDYPQAPNRAFDAHPASEEEYLSLMATLGVDHTVIVQPSFYGFDNSCTLAAMSALGKGMGQALGQAAAAPSGPVVRVARGNNVTVVPVGAR